MSVITYYFLPSLRRGMAALLEEEDTPSQGRASVKVLVKMGTDGSFTADEDGTISKQVALFGPGDVLGFNPSTIIRTDPGPNIGEFEPNYFPFIEFSEADFLWRYTPKTSQSEGTPPWLTLLVLKTAEGELPGEFSYDKQVTKALPASIKVLAGTALPSLAISWRYAHVQVVGPAGLAKKDLKEIIKTTPEQALCRLFCPRHLEPNRKYTAFVVPTFERGVLAGLGLSGTPKQEWAWTDTSLDTTPLQLPYYYRWEFRTGARGDFENLVRRLEPKELTDMGLRSADIANPGYGLKDQFVQGLLPKDEHKRLLNMEGALQSLDTVYTEWGADATSISELDAFQKSLRQVIDGAYRVPDKHGKEEALQVVAPPVYGYHQVGRNLSREIETPSGELNWWIQLNLDPRHRFAAGRGDQVMKDNQEALMEEAWRQLGDIKRANRQLRLGLWGREISDKLHQRIRRLAPDRLLSMAGPLATKIKLDPEQSTTLFGRLQTSPIPRGLMEGAARKVMRARGPIRRRQQLPSSGLAGQLFHRLNEQKLTVVTDQLAPSAMPQVSINQEELQKVMQDTLPGQVSLTGAVPRELPTGPELTRFRDRLKTGLRPEDLTRGQIIESTSQPGAYLVKQVIPKSVVASRRSHNIQGRLQAPLLARGRRDIWVVLGNTNRRTKVNPQDGSFTMQVPIGQHRLFIPELDLAPEVEVKQGEILLLDIVATQPTRVKGLVQADEAGRTLRSKVMVEGTNVSFTTTLDGRYSIELPPGDYSLFFQSEKRSKRVGLAIDHGDSILLNVVLEQPTVNPSPSLVHHMFFENTLIPGIATSPAIPEKINLEQLEARIVADIKPVQTIQERLENRIKGFDFRRLNDRPLSPILWCPDFHNPMYSFLTKEDLLPGIEKINQNTVGILKTNRRFMESFLLGLNHSFSEEARWREYPIPLDSTAFRQFWDVNDYEPSEEEQATFGAEKKKDIDQIAAWNNSRLGENGLSKEDNIVVLIRGDLIRKYPETEVYLVEAQKIQGQWLPGLPEFGGNEGKVYEPAFTGKLPPDIVFWGFPLTEDTVRKGKYFLIFEEQAFQLRLGLDDNPDGSENTALENLNFAAFGMTVPGSYLQETSPGVGTNDSAASLAKQFLQQPVRIAIDVQQLLPERVNQVGQ